MKIKKVLFINLIILSFLCSCTNEKSSLPTGIDNISNIKKRNGFDPSSGGAIDPRLITNPQIMIEGTKGKLVFNNGENNLILNLTLKPPSGIQGQITPLTGLKIIKGEFYIGNLKIPVEIEASKVNSELNYSFEITGLVKNAQILLKTDVIDKNNEVMGTNEFLKTVTEKNSVSQINVQIDHWW